MPSATDTIEVRPYATAGVALISPLCYPQSACEFHQQRPDSATAI